MTHYRAQFQTADGRTHAVVDSTPITLHRLALLEALLDRRVVIDGVLPEQLIDLSATPPEWLSAAEQVLARSA